MVLVEERDDLVARFEARDPGTSGFDDAGAVGSRDDVVTGSHGVFTLYRLVGWFDERWGKQCLGDDEISIVERCVIEVHENVMIT